MTALFCLMLIISGFGIYASYKANTKETTNIFGKFNDYQAIKQLLRKADSYGAFVECELRINLFKETGPGSMPEYNFRLLLNDLRCDFMNRKAQMEVAQLN